MSDQFDEESRRAFEQYEKIFNQAAEDLGSTDPAVMARGLTGLLESIGSIMEDPGMAPTPAWFANVTGGPTGGEQEPEAFEPVEGGEGTTEPFLMVLTDRKWPYNNAYVSTDAALLHYLEHGREPYDLDGRLMEAEAKIDEGTYVATSVLGPVNSQAEWWGLVSEASKDIPASRHFEGIYY